MCLESGVVDVRASVVMACRNGAVHLAETLEAVLAQEVDGPWEIVFADNGSTDGSRALFDARAARETRVAMRSVDAGARPGKSYALNRGIAAAASDVIVLCDSDDIPAPGWLQAMAEALEVHDFVAACNELDRLNGGPAGRYRDVPHSTWDLAFAPFSRSTAGATMGFTRALYDAVGGFGTGFQPEDDEFCIRADLAGFQLVSVPGAVVHYRLRQSLPAIYRQAYSYSRTDVQVAHAYRHLGPPQRRAWRALAREVFAVGCLWGRLRLRGGPADTHREAALRWRAGVVAGQIAGVLRYGARPTMGRPPLEPGRTRPLHPVQGWTTRPGLPDGTPAA